MSAVADNVIEFPGRSDDIEQATLLKPGIYAAVYLRHSGLQVFGQPKLQVLFQLLEAPLLYLPRWYRVTTYKGRVAAPAASDIVRELAAVLGKRIRPDRIPVGELARIPVSAMVATVETDQRQKPLAEVNHYSKISRLLGKA